MCVCVREREDVEHMCTKKKKLKKKKVKINLASTAKSDLIHVRRIWVDEVEIAFEDLK
jgi:hypothetical protein